MLCDNVFHNPFARGVHFYPAVRYVTRASVLFDIMLNKDFYDFV